MISPLCRCAKGRPHRVTAGVVVRLVAILLDAVLIRCFPSGGIFFSRSFLLSHRVSVTVTVWTSSRLPDPPKLNNIDLYPAFDFSGNGDFQLKLTSSTLKRGGRSSVGLCVYRSAFTRPINSLRPIGSLWLRWLCHAEPPLKFARSL